MYKLRVKGISEQPYWLAGDKTIVGSSDTCALTISDKSVEPHHCIIVKQDSGYYLSPVGMGNHVEVNNAPVGKHFQLRAGDVIKLGELELVVEAGNEQANPVAVMPWRIMGLNADHKQINQVVKQRLTIGRSSSCDIVINGAFMSRRHAELRVEEGKLFVADLNSSNGTEVNGRKVIDRQLYTGDYIAFDRIKFMVVGPHEDGVQSYEDEVEQATVFLQNEVANTQFVTKDQDGANHKLNNGDSDRSAVKESAKQVIPEMKQPIKKVIIKEDTQINIKKSSVHLVLAISFIIAVMMIVIGLYF